MYAPAGVKTNPNMPIPDTMRAWVLGNRLRMYGVSKNHR